MNRLEKAAGSEAGRLAARIDPTSVHPLCVVCAEANPRGLGLTFRPSPDGRGVETVFDCSEVFQGYAGLIHGGVVSALLDGAMAHCLFHAGRTAHTGNLSVRFRHPLLVGRPARVRARLDKSRGRAHFLAAELEQDGTVKAVASATFLETPDE